TEGGRSTGVGSVAELRERVFGLNSGGGALGSGRAADLPNVFKDWISRMRDNFTQMKKGQPMTGFLLPFEDHRSTEAMHASVTIPSSGNTDYA
ncbi:phospholipase, partial [Trinickia caryophylli]